MLTFFRKNCRSNAGSAGTFQCATILLRFPRPISSNRFLVLLPSIPCLCSMHCQVAELAILR
jgi:hypothetical protein